MRRSLIAVCLLLLTPSSVQACYEDHNAVRAGSMSILRGGRITELAQAAQRDRLLDMSIFAGGSGVLILLSVFMRTLLRAARPAAAETLDAASRVPLAMPADSPPCEPLCVLVDFDSQDHVWSSVEFHDLRDESLTGTTLPVESFCCLV